MSKSRALGKTPAKQLSRTHPCPASSKWIAMVGTSVTLAMSVVPQYAAAEVVRYTFAGEITTITFNESNVLGDLQIGDPFDGFFEFDLSIPDGSPDPNVGQYDQDGVMAVNLPELSLNYSGHLFMGVFNDSWFSDADFFFMEADNSFGDFNVSAFGVQLTDSTASAFDSDALPSLLQLPEFDGTLFRLSGFRISTLDSFQVRGALTSLILVPAPSTVIVALALFGGAGLRRCRRRSV